MRFLVGCYTSETDNNGLHLLELDGQNNSINSITSHVVANPSYLTFSSDGSVIYTVNESHTPSDKVTAISFDRKTQKLETINEIDICGADPCFISTDSKGKYLFTANYSDGTLSCVSLHADGSLANLVQVIKHPTDPSDELHPNTHMHAALLSPDKQFLLVTNLGLDTLSLYNYQPDNHKEPLKEIPEQVYQFPIGTGPRHLLFSSNGKFAYVVGELDGSVHVLAWDNGVLSFVQKAMLMPSDFNGKNSAADIHFGADGRFIYLSNRGDANQLISFAVNQETGELTLLQRTATLGNGPRNFAVDPSGNYLLVAHQYSNEIRLFKIDKITGGLIDTGISHAINNPVFVSFLKDL
ncbi:lactonase family protein [Pedobacter frigiditerrae]|uniref:Lactonase family protein n=1 Tax=Pedobacter frigiditerrae TaxID=2530452 RepID=A0A4R0N4C8_9SPHI|nr:lactonase family protein [Pedobacter frigiditerrae]TCC94217.1 lactonase family protein [Pedobacter frigiditerrae]